MGVRDIFPHSIAFDVTIQSRDRSLRVAVVLDLQERLIFVPSGILPDIVDRIPQFVDQLSDITATMLACQKWDGCDPLTQYQVVQVLTGYWISRSRLRLNVILGAVSLVSVYSLDQRSIIRLDDAE